jgi:hypothetical protein
VPKSSALSIVSSFEGYAPFGPISSRSAEQRTRSSTCPLPTAPPGSDPSDGGVAFDRRERGWGVAAALDGGRAGLLVPPAELEPPSAILLVTEDEVLRTARSSPD